MIVNYTESGLEVINPVAYKLMYYIFKRYQQRSHSN
jgi:hypothetical protein